MVKKVVIGILVVFVIYILSLVIATGIYQRNIHQEVYKKEYYVQFEDPRKKVLSFAVLAPSSHNIQPWRVTLDDDNDQDMYLYIEESRVLPIVDEKYNQMVISCGTFLAYALEAGNELGYQVTYELFPSGMLSENPTLDELKSTPIAKITVIKENETEVSSFDAFASSTTKATFADEEINESTKTLLTNYQTSNIMINVITEDLQELREILIKGVQIESTKKEAMEETSSIFRYTNKEKNTFKYGLSMNTGFNSKLKLYNIEFLNMLFPMNWEKEGSFWLSNETKNIESCNTFVVIYGEDSRLSQIESGIAFGHIYFQLKKENLSVQPIVQVTQLYDEMIETRSLFNQKYANSNTTQIIFRVGKVTQDSLLSMRLNVEDLLREE